MEKKNENKEKDGEKRERGNIPVSQQNYSSLPLLIISFSHQKISKLVTSPTAVLCDWSRTVDYFHRLLVGK